MSIDQTTLTITIQHTQIRPLSRKEIDEVKNLLAFNLSYALKGCLLFDIEEVKE